MANQRGKGGTRRRVENVAEHLTERFGLRGRREKGGRTHGDTSSRDVYDNCSPGEMKFHMITVMCTTCSLVLLVRSNIIRHSPSQNVFCLIPRPFQCLCPSQSNHAILPLVVSASTSFSSSAFFQYGQSPYSPGSLLSTSLKAAVFGASRGTEKCSSRMPSPRYVE